MVRIIYSREGNREELVVTSAYLPYSSDEPPSTKEMRDVTITATAEAGSSSLDATPINTTSYGGAHISTPEETAWQNTW
jgi:hypothetical protein